MTIMKPVAITKQIILIRNDIQYTPIELAERVAHVSVRLYNQQLEKRDSVNRSLLRQWWSSGEVKQIISTNLNDILTIQKLASDNNINNTIINDIESNICCLGLGVHYNDILNTLISPYLN